jgi:hypothetical protein
MLDPRTTPSKALINSRRSERVVARIRVQVRKQAEGDATMLEVGHTLVVNAHGALLYLAMKVQVNELLAIRNMYSKEERHSRVVRIGKDEASQNEVAIEFTEAAPHFWHIDFPPSDWRQTEES